MPRARISKQDILKAAARVIHQRGEHALSVRSIAAELGCSTQPLYSQFGSQEQLQQALVEYIRDTYLQFHCTSYKEFGQNFLAFAQRESELFRFLYLRRRAPGERLLDDANFDKTVELLARNLEMSPRQATEMHLQMQYHCYGLGVMIATGYRAMSDEEISDDLREFYSIMLRHYKQAASEEELQYWMARSRNLIL
ncbi:helix-turn-helix domain-containing protein [Ruthenibacterium sp. CLA-JM-H11]|uniref:Helix-turn-helix domain-containing protein n=1 Tax=Ruthenibacterium intestinale TaxID=3133163 RepID=A0ABV1GER7_9FIRM